MSNPLPEKWFEVSPTKYEYRSGPYKTYRDGTPKPGTLYLTVVAVERNGNSIEVSVDSHIGGGYSDGAASLSVDIPIEMINRLVTT
jgi:hypothetical protein